MIERSDDMLWMAMAAMGVVCGSVNLVMAWAGFARMQSGAPAREHNPWMSLLAGVAGWTWAVTAALLRENWWRPPFPLNIVLIALVAPVLVGLIRIGWGKEQAGGKSQNGDRGTN